MSKPNLSHIYRNGTRRVDADALDADAIASLAGGATVDDQLDSVAASALNSDLIHFARDLERDSAALSESVTGLLRADGASHRRAAPARRSANGRRGWRVASAIAASLVAAVVIWSANLQHRSAPLNTSASDRIFSSLSDHDLAQQPMQSDRIFHGDFRSDEIFKSRSGG